MNAKDWETGAPAFPKTRLSAVVGVRSDDPEVRRRACQALVSAYWKPIYKHLRLKWRSSPEEAEDLTQAFFAAMLEKRFFQKYDPERARFRSYIRASLDHFIQDDQKAGRRLKRGGDATFHSLEFASAEGELARGDTCFGDDLDALFDLEWKRSLFAAAADALREDCEARGRSRHYRVFEAYYLAAEEPPSYADIAEALGIAVTDVTNSLSYARRQFRRFVLEKLREVSASEEEFHLEASSLGVFD